MTAKSITTTNIRDNAFIGADHERGHYVDASQDDSLLGLDLATLKVSSFLYMSSLDAFLNHPIETLERALHIRRQIDQLNEVLKELFGPTPVSLAGIQTSAPKRRGRPPKVKQPVAVVEGGSGVVAEPAPTVKAKKKGGMSAEGRARIVAAQKKRWAKVKGEKSAPAKAAPVAKKKKRKMSAEGRARIVAAVKARWARVKNGK